jgi:hypothetical protein
LMPEQAEVSLMTYRIKEIAIEYNNLGHVTPTPSDTNGTEPTNQAGDVVERYTLHVTANGTYTQIKALLDDFKSLGKNVIISNINMTPFADTAGPTPSTTPGATPSPTPEPTQEAILIVEFWIDYYGIEKLDTTIQDPLNQWNRETQPTSTIDPYSGIETLPSETTIETTTAETTAAA